MAGPSTEYLAEQLDRLRDQIGGVKDELQLIRREGLDEVRRIADTFADQFQDIRENMARGTDLVRLRDESATRQEALKVEQSLVREDLARLQVETTSLNNRFDKAHDLLKQLVFATLGTMITLGSGLFWKASQAVSQLQEQGRRIEAIEKASSSQANLRDSIDQIRRDSIDQIRKTLDERLPAPPAKPSSQP